MLYSSAQPRDGFPSRSAKPGLPVGHGSMQVRLPKLLKAEMPASLKMAGRWKPSLLSVTGRILAVINFFICSAFVESHLQRLKPVNVESVVDPIGVYFMAGVGLFVIIASLLALFAKNSHCIRAVALFPILLLIYEPVTSSYRYWATVSSYEYSISELIAAFLPVVWFLLNLLQTLGLYARAFVDRDGDKLTRQSVPSKA